MRYRTIVAALFCGAMTQAGCTPLPPPSPPPPAAETMPNPPVTVTPLIWQPGHWDWTGSSYVWQPGQYVPRDNLSGLWISGYWTLNNGGWVWQPAHWQ